MRYALLAIGLALLVPSTVVEAGSKGKSGFFFSIGSSGRYYHRPYYVPSARYYSSFDHGRYYSHRPYYGAYRGRYAVPRVYSPYRYGDYAGDRLGIYGYRSDHAYRRGTNFDRGYYYGPAVQRYHRNARDFPSYHYDRRESYNRGTTSRWDRR